MERFRNTWLAIVGGAILVTLSVSAAFGAAPSGASDSTRGQTIAGFVHGLIFDAGQDADEEAVESEACDADDEDSEADATESAEAEADDLDDAEECDVEDCDVDEVDPETSTESFGAVLDSEQCDADDVDEDEDAEEVEDAPDDEDAGGQRRRLTRRVRPGSRP